MTMRNGIFNECMMTGLSEGSLSFFPALDGCPAYPGSQQGGNFGHRVIDWEILESDRWWRIPPPSLIPCLLVTQICACSGCGSMALLEVSRKWLNRTLVTSLWKRDRIYEPCLTVLRNWKYPASLYPPLRTYDQPVGNNPSGESVNFWSPTRADALQHIGLIQVVMGKKLEIDLLFVCHTLF